MKKLFLLAAFVLNFGLWPLTTAAQYTTLLNFEGISNGSVPKSSLISVGTFLYGMTSVGGANDAGIIFKILPDGTGFVNIHDFDSNAFGNGGYPQECSLIYDGAFLYGMTSNGGANADGFIFKINPDGSGYVNLHEFGGSGDGFLNCKSLFTDGLFLYGMTHFGGANGDGIIFKIKNDGTGYTHLLDFDGLNGSFPEGSLISDGTFLYGMATRGGTNSAGTIFKILPDGSGYLQLHEFGGSGDGSLPGGALISIGGFLYGTTSDGGTNSRGSIFRIMTDGSGYLKIYDFSLGPDGNYPYGSLISDGTFLYGTTSRGGLNDEGTIFKIMPDGTNYLKLFDFKNNITGRYPTESLISDGSSFYGMTPDGGTNGLGTVFKYSVASLVPTITNFTPASGPVGTTVTITGTNFNTTLANNIVYFGATKATVTAATATQLTVTVPIGATYQPISVLVNGLTAFSSKPFAVTFPDGGILDACSFAAKVDVTTGSKPYSVAIGDLDADGKADLAVANETSNTVSVYKNISTLGSLTSSSFAAKVDFVTGAAPYFVTIQDLDGDGKPELIVTNNDADNVSIYKNNTSLGVINSSSFSAKVDFSTGQNPWNATVADFDLDGKPDLAVVNDVDNSVSILKNTCSLGIIDATSFAPKVDFVTGNFPIGIANGDLDGDGKIDLAITNQTDNSFSVLRNTSITGIINASSFAAKIDFPTGLDPYSVAIGDFDGNNKPEIAVSNYSSGSVSVFGNTSTIGSISLSSKVDFVSGAGSLMVSISDIDGDGKPDLLVTNGGARISILRNVNTSPPITLSSFSSKIDFNSTSDPYGLAIGDLDGNGKPDIVGTNFNGTTTSILRNTVSSLPAFTAASFLPTSGPVGTTVTITGINFSTTPINNTVKFNGIVATVTGSTSTSITAIVPAGATTGSISLEIGCVTALTVIPFTVTSGNTITITTQPSDFIACAGQAATFTTAATGTTNIIYKWQFSIDGVAPFTDINNGGGYSGATTATLTVNTTGNFGSGRYRCRVNGDLAAEVITNDEGLFINPIPIAPTATNTTRCGPGSVTLTATGGTNGQYRWYTAATGGTAITGEVNSSYVTPAVTTSTTYFVAINDGSCESVRTPVVATINIPPAIPIITSSIAAVGNALTICSTTSLTLSAPAGFASYNWSTGAITQQISVGTSGNYSVTVTDAAGCVSPTSVALVVTVIAAPCNNQAPVISTTFTSTVIEGLAIINLLDLISDADNNLVLSSLAIAKQPTSGATATIVNGVLEIDYKGVSFSGRDQLTIQVCDVFGECTQQILEIEVIGDIEIYNGISPNGDEQNDFFLIRYIELLPDTQNNRVTIYNRWGSKVFEVSDYNNTTQVFRGLNDGGGELPSGTYFYKIEFASGRKSETGYLTLKR